MRAVSFLVASLAGSWVTLMPAIAARPPEFAQATRIVGKPPSDLGGTWFLYTQAQFTAGKSRAFPPELITAAPAADGGMDLKLLDVRMPKAIDEPYQAGNHQPVAWEPTPQEIAVLRKEWAKLPPATDKDWRKSEQEYERIDFTVVSPDKYGEAFADQPPEIRQGLDGSLFAFVISEKYRAHPVAPGEHVAPVMLRKTIYIVRKTNDSVMEGKHFTGYVAAGPGIPLPINTSGPFRLYRLAKGKTASPVTPAPSKIPRSRRGQG